MLLSTSTSQLFRASTLPTPSSPAMSPSNEDMIMDFPSSPPLFAHDPPSAPTTPGQSRPHRGPNATKRFRRLPHVSTDPYPAAAFAPVSTPRRLSAIPTDNDIENAYRHMSDYESPMGSPAQKRKHARSVFHDSTLQPPTSHATGPLLSPVQLRAPLLPAPRASAPATEDDLNETLLQAIKLLSLEKKPESYPSTAASSSYSPQNSSAATSFAEESHFQSPGLPDPEELLKEIVRNSLQSLHALRSAKAMEREIRQGRRSSMDMDMEGVGGGFGRTGNGSPADVVALLDQSVSMINSARQYIEFAETTLSDTRDHVRDGLMKG